ncbi:DUF4241 domain-containing protein [Plantactinospora solaniradicis]|uniref:DUF4241 domain-containing protein n=1 Tax=Plantactinospora solaniradicis TaxID=1723736 RepID=A0ABW1K9U1_9ACTN
MFLTCLALVSALAVVAATVRISSALIERVGQGVAEERAVEVTYCAGWEPGSRKPVGVMGVEEARRRDSAGEPYAVLLTAGARPRALLQIDWGHRYLGLFLFDEHGRRDRAYDYRELEPGLLDLRQYEQWRYGSADEPEFPERGWHFTLTARPDSDTADVELDHGSLFQTSRDVPERHRTLRRAPFADWTAYADGRMLGFKRNAGHVALVPARHQEDQGHREAATPPWTAPSGLRPRHLEALFTRGSRFSDTESGVAFVTEPQPAGVLRVPTGAVIAADPGTLGSSDEPYTVRVPAGDHPVLVAGLRRESEGWNETTAAMVRILDKPTASWELAVRPGQDIRLLGDDEFYGFGVDTGTGAFLDASGRDALGAAYEHRQQSDAREDDKETEVADPATGTNLIAFPSGAGDGSYPVWIGRTADGEVTCLVADMLVLHDMRPLPPTAPDTAVFLTPAPTGSGVRPEPNPADPEATAEFLAKAAARIGAEKE